MFSKEEEQQVRERLAETLRWVVSQRLAPKIGGGRVMIPEIMGSNLRSREAVQLGENDVRNLHDIITQSSQEGWTTFEGSLCQAYEDKLITEETAMLLAVNKGKMRQTLDRRKKLLGHDDHGPHSFKLAPEEGHEKKPTAAPAAIPATAAPLPTVPAPAPTAAEPLRTAALPTVPANLKLAT
jgi:twitching motility protein PilT